MRTRRYNPYDGDYQIRNWKDRLKFSLLVLVVAALVGFIDWVIRNL